MCMSIDKRLRDDGDDICSYGDLVCGNRDQSNKDHSNRNVKYNC